MSKGTRRYVIEPAEIVQLYRLDHKTFMISIKLMSTGQMATFPVSQHLISSAILRYIQMFGDPESVTMRDMPVNVSVLMDDEHIASITRVMRTHKTDAFINKQRIYMKNKRKGPVVDTDYKPVYRSPRVDHQRRGIPSIVTKGRCNKVLSGNLIEVELDNGQVQLISLLGVRVPSFGDIGFTEATDRAKKIVQGKRVTIDRQPGQETSTDRWVAYVYAEPSPAADQLWYEPGGPTDTGELGS